MGDHKKESKIKRYAYSNEYLSKYTNITPSQTSPGDIELAQAEYPADDWNQDDEILLRVLTAGGLPGTEKDVDELLRRKRSAGRGLTDT